MEPLRFGVAMVTEPPIQVAMVTERPIQVAVVTAAGWEQSGSAIVIIGRQPIKNY